MRQFLIKFLKELEAAIPPPENCHHAITFARFGSDVAGWHDKLALQVNSGGVFTCFFLEDEDLNKSPRQLVSDVASELSIPNDTLQLGVGFGQYTSGAVK